MGSVSDDPSTPWTVDNALPSEEFFECWDGTMIVYGLTRNQARAKYAWDYGEAYAAVWARRVWVGPWSAVGDVPCEDCECGAVDRPGDDCTAFGIVRKRMPNYTPGWEVGVA